MSDAEAPLEVHADLDPNHPPLLDGFPGTPRHRVKAHDRVLPPKEVQEDPRLIRLSDFDPEGWPKPEPPQPRVIPVRDHLRRNPRQRKEPTMTSILPPENRTDVTAMKDAHAVTALPGGVAQARASDPATSHEAAKVATGSLRRRMRDVLDVFQLQATEYVKTDDEDPGYTDEELVRRMEALDRPGSPSGWRTARKDLVRVGLLEPKMLGDIEDTRRTRRGNPAIIYRLTDAGASR